MTGTQLIEGRKQKRWTQEIAASKLGVSQPYLSLTEKGMRRVTEKLARKAATVYGLSAATLPGVTNWDRIQPGDEKTLATDLASLGYPGFSYLKSRPQKNPGEVLLSALSAKCLDSRVIEALPWLLLEYPDLDWQALVSVAKSRDLQNKLGFVTCVARRLAERRGQSVTVELLLKQELGLQRSRLLVEETLCHASLSRSEIRWLKTNRPDEAKFWRLLTDLSPDHVSHAFQAHP